MSSDLVCKVSDKANVILSNVSGVASSVTQGVGDVVGSVSSSMGDAVHTVSSGMMRLMTAPPDENELFDELDDHPYIFATPNALSPLAPSTDLSLQFEYSSSKEATTAIDNELGISENYFYEPEKYEVSSGSGIKELEKAIDKCKELILACEGASERRRILVHRLIQLRIYLEKQKDEAEIASLGIQVVRGHQLHPLSPPIKHTSKQFCDKCSLIIWGFVHTMYKCSLCEYQCHRKCVSKVHRKCASVRFSEHPNYIFKISPEIGLSAQDYRCAECSRLLARKNPWTEPRLCDYTGSYYCTACHWNCREISPARVIHNWDFEEQPVSRTSKQLLFFMHRKPLLNLEDLNPHLFLFVDELSLVKKLREDLICMKAYLTTCRTAQESRLLRRLEEKQHFVDDAHLYSLEDLLSLNKGTLVPFLTDVHQAFSSHIKETCLVCKGKGFICEICKDPNSVYPFDEDVNVCKSCQATFHSKCFPTKDKICPRCLRQQTRKNSLQLQDEEL